MDDFANCCFALLIIEDQYNTTYLVLRAALQHRRLCRNFVISKMQRI